MSGLAQDRLAAIESLDDVVIAVDRELRVTSWNGAAERLLGRTAAQAMGAAVMTMVTPRQRPEFGVIFNRALAGETIARQEIVMMAPDGAEVAIAVAMAPIAGVDGKPAGFIFLGHDTDAQHRLQVQLLQSKRMESAGQLAGGIAHEFNNILTTILALTELSSRSLPADSAARDDLEEIHEQASKGARLVRHLLAFSRRQLLRMEPLHLGPLIQEIDPLLQWLVSEQIVLAVDASSDSRAVEADRAQIELVILELVANAADAMSHGGTLEMGIQPVTVAGDALLKPGDYVKVTFRDDGTGIDPAIQSRVFEPFFTTKEGHAGLGLAMVEGVVHQHGGSINIESIPGDSTTVTILLPAAVQAAPSRIEPPASSDNGESHETILVVEDELAVRTVIVRGLRAHGYTVLEAKHGEDALIVAERHAAPIHLVITDVVMPEMSGPELYHHLRRWFPTMRILFISGYAKNAIPPEVLAEGHGASFLAKPFTLAELFNEVRRMIQLPRAKAPAGV